jgi:L-fucose isomerase-like protein
MLTITPVASEFLPTAARDALVAAFSARWRGIGIEHRLAAPGQPVGAGELPVLLVLTGGTERAALEAIGEAPLPAVLLAHPSQNSFPACLEILARLQQLGRRGEIVFLGDGPDGDRALQEVAAAARAHARLAGRRLGCIGEPSDWLVASMPSAAAVKDAWGVDLVEVPLAEVMDAMRDVPAGAPQLTDLVADLVGAADAVVEPTSADLQAAATVLVALREVCRRHSLDACTVRCFDLVTRLRTTGCFALSQLNDEGFIAGCEGDVPATLTMMWLHALAGEVPFVANPQQVDVANHRLWISHCTIGRSLLDGYRVRSHFESGLGVAIEGRLPQQPVTIARVGGADLRSVLVTDGRIVAGGDSPDRCRTQLEIEVDADLGELLRRPLGNHHVMIRGHWAGALGAYRRLFL